jgi:hypothetical protein
MERRTKKISEKEDFFREKIITMLGYASCTIITCLQFLFRDTQRYLTAVFDTYERLAWETTKVIDRGHLVALVTVRCAAGVDGFGRLLP